MGVPIDRAAIVLLASGLSRRYGNRDKLTANLGGKHLIEHSAAELTKLPALARIAVTPSDRNDLRNDLINRFVIAINRKPKHGLGHSIAVGVQVALQFKPDAIVICMGDMPFIESWMVDSLLAKLGDADIVHAGAPDRVHPPTAFGAACFDQLKTLDGDDGARRIIGQGGFRVTGINVPLPLLVDVDTRDELEYAKRQLALREQIALHASRPPLSTMTLGQAPDPLPLSPLRATRR